MINVIYCSLGVIYKKRAENEGLNEDTTVNPLVAGPPSSPACFTPEPSSDASDKMNIMY